MLKTVGKPRDEQAALARLRNRLAVPTLLKDN